MYSLNEKGKISIEKVLPVNKVANSLLDRNAFEPVIYILYFSSVYSEIIAFSKYSHNCISSINKKFCLFFTYFEFTYLSNSTLLLILVNLARL